MRIVYFLILLSCSCKRNEATVRTFETAHFVLIDSACEATESLNAENYDSEYPIYFLGQIKDTIKIGKRYLRRINEVMVDYTFPDFTRCLDTTLDIFVDTSIKTNSTVEYLSENEKISKDSTKNYKAFLVTIQNRSDSIIYLGRTFSLFTVNREARDKTGKWVKVDKKLKQMGLCLTGQPTIWLKPGEIIIAKAKRYAGSYVTDFRLALDCGDAVIYSNIFRDSIDLKVLNHASESK
jgi:hypothetical protein